MGFLGLMAGLGAPILWVGVALPAVAAMGLAWRWGARAAPAAVGFAISVAALMALGASYLVGRLEGARPAGLGAVVAGAGRGIAILAPLSVTAAVLGLGIGLLLRRLRQGR